MYRRIMIVVDDTPASRAAIDEGTSLAARHGAEAVYFALMPAYPVAVADELAIGAVACLVVLGIIAAIIVFGEMQDDE